MIRSHPLLETVDGLDEMEFHELSRFNQGTAGVFQCSTGTSPWERHPDDDELLHVLEGETIVTVLTDGGPVETPVRAGSVFIVPKGLWHRQHIPEKLKEFFVTPGATEHSTAEDPRSDP